MAAGHLVSADPGGGPACGVLEGGTRGGNPRSRTLSRILGAGGLSVKKAQLGHRDLGILKVSVLGCPLFGQLWYNIATYWGGVGGVKTNVLICCKYRKHDF